MIVVSDTTPISNLIQIGQFELLRALYQRILIPRTVYDELIFLSKFQIPIVEILAQEWVEIVEVKSQTIVDRLLATLDRGEAEAIALAVETRADYLLIDEKEGRKVAKENHIALVGTLGVLINGKKQGLIDNMKLKAA